MKLWMVSAIHNRDYRHRCLPYFDMNLRFLLPPELLYRHNSHCISRIFYRKKVVPTSLCRHTALLPDFRQGSLQRIRCSADVGKGVPTFIRCVEYRVDTSV